MKNALVIIDVQKDYFPGGAFPLWNTEATLICTEQAIRLAQSKNIPVILIQHIANPQKGIAPFFNAGTDGVNIHPRILEAAPEAPIVVKEFADSFVATNLEETLSTMEVAELCICGMMTQNCVTHTAISKSAEKYKISILSDCCTTVDAMMHNIALHAVSTRVEVVESKDAF